MGGIGDRVVESKKYGLLFPGQGSQKVGMAKEFYESSAAAKSIFDMADEVLGRKISQLCFQGPEDDLVTTSNSQPAIFTASIASLGALLEKRGHFSGNGMFSSGEVGEIAEVVMGLSLGEPTALVAGGALSFEDGLRFVEKRGKFMQEASESSSGKMASILGMDIKDIEDICTGVGGCQIANLNCPGQVVISGHSDKVQLASDLASAKGAKRVIMLKVSGAFHSELMREAHKKLEEFLKTIEIKSPVVDFISNIDAELTKDPEKIKKNLAKQLTNRTLWQSCMEKSISLGITEYLEVGPGKVLMGLARKIDRSVRVTAIHSPDDLAE